MAGSKNKFAEEAGAARKAKAIAGTSTPPPKRARYSEKIVMLPPPPPPPVIEELTLAQLESSMRGEPKVAFVQARISQGKAEAEVTWPRGIQHLAFHLDHAYFGQKTN